MGLSLCRALIEQHAGQLWFDSTEGVGSTFFAIFPIRLDQEPPDVATPGVMQQGKLYRGSCEQSVRAFSTDVYDLHGDLAKPGVTCFTN